MLSMKEGTRMTRLQFPVVAGFAMAINKAQGLTIKEGVVIHLVQEKKVQTRRKASLAQGIRLRSQPRQRVNLAKELAAS